MKHTTLLSLPGLLLAGSVMGQTVTVSTGPSNSDQVFYSLQNGVLSTAPLADWDLAFEISGFTASILVNTAKGNTVFETGLGVADWASITAPDEAAWTALNNSETDWAKGALTNGNDLDQGGFNLGWGTYSMVTHVVAGTQLYVVHLASGAYKKLRIDALASGTYQFTYANLDGTDEQSGSLVKSAFAGRSFGYWNMTTNAALDREPPAAEWDLLFTKYLSDLGIWYGVAGVLHNRAVTVAQLDGIDPVSVSHAAADGQYSADINVIGYDWKSFTGGVYVYPQDRAYFVKDVAGNIWKLIFTGYGGAANGDMTFNKELVSATGVDDIAADNGRALVYPNPAEGGIAQLLIDVPATEAMLTIHDLHGRLVHGERLTGIAPLAVRTIDVASLASGAYVLRVEHATGVASGKLIVR